MANEEFLDALSPAAEKRLKSYHSEVMKLITDIGKVNTMQIGAKPPSGTDAAIKKLVDDVAKTDAAVKKLQASYIDASTAATKSANNQDASAKKILSSLEKETASRQALDKQRQKAANDNAVRQAKEDAAILKQLAIEDRAAQKKIANSKKIEAQKEKEWQQFQKDFAKYEAALLKEGNHYNQIQAEVNKLIPTYQNLAAKRELGLKLTKEETNQLSVLQGQLMRYQNSLIKIDEGMNRHTRKVGDYARANSNLTNSISQISRELPNFGQSFSIGVLSLTNNIGAVLDAVKQVKAENVALQAEGKNTKAVFSQVLTALLSWQTKLFVGIGIFSAYSKEIGAWASSIWNATDALDANAESQKKVNEAKERFNNNTAEYLQNAIKEYDATRRLREVIQDQTKDYEERLNAAERLKSKTGSFLDAFTKEQVVLAESGKFVKGYKDAVEELTAAQSKRADAELKIKASEKTFADASALIEEIRLRQQLNDEFNKTGANIDEIKKKISDRADKFNEMDEYVSNFGKVEVDALGRFSDAGIARLQTIYDNLRAEFETERKAVDDAYKATSRLDDQRKKENNKKGRTYDPEGAILDARLRYLKQLAETTQDEYNTEKELRERQIEDIKKLATNEKASFDGRLKAYGDYLQKKTDLINDGRDFELVQLQKDLGIEQEESEKARRASLKKAGNNAKAIWAINVFYQEEAIKRYAAYDAKVASINEKSAQEQTALAVETAEAEILIKTKQREMLAENDKLIRDSAIKTYQDVIAEEKNSLAVRQASFEAMLSLQRKQLDLDKNRELADDPNNADNIVLKYRALNKELDELATKGSPIADAVNQANEALHGMAKSITDSFLGDAGLGSLSQIFDGTFASVMEGFDNIADKGESAMKKVQYALLTTLQIAQEFYNKMSQASQENFEIERTNSERKYKIDLLFAGDNEAAKEELQKQAEERTRRINNREAKAKKELAKFNVILSASQGAIAAFSDGNVIKGAIFAAIIAGIAAIQIAQINAQSVPQYWKGTDNAPGGLAWTQEKGREIITDKQGRIKSTGSDKGATLTTLAKGDKVYTAEQTRQLMFNNELNGIMNSNRILPHHTQAFPIDELRAIGDRMEAAAGRQANITLQTNNDSLGNIISVVASGTQSANARKTLTPQKFQR